MQPGVHFRAYGFRAQVGGGAAPTDVRGAAEVARSALPHAAEIAPRLEAGAEAAFHDGAILDVHSAKSPMGLYSCAGESHNATPSTVMNSMAASRGLTVLDCVDTMAPTLPTFRALAEGSARGMQQAGISFGPRLPFLHFLRKAGHGERVML